MFNQKSDEKGIIVATRSIASSLNSPGIRHGSREFLAGQSAGASGEGNYPDVSEMNFCSFRFKAYIPRLFR
jgi:hypothetical protein